MGKQARRRKSPWGFQSKMGYISPNSDHARFTSCNICAIIEDESISLEQFIMLAMAGLGLI